MLIYTNLNFPQFSLVGFHSVKINYFITNSAIIKCSLVQGVNYCTVRVLRLVKFTSE